MHTAKMKNNLPIRAVKAVIRNKKGEILLLQRNPQISLQDNWDLPGGLVETGENFKNALIREVMEELNLTINITKQAGKWHFIRFKDKQLVHVQNYHCTVNSGDIQLSEEHHDYKWVNPSDIRKYLVKDDSFYTAIN
ncbi:MAG: NUDIX domain-containing protein [Microgenomates group bacterium]